MAHPPSPPPAPRDDAGAYVGLTEEQARARAAEHGWRTVRTLPPDAVVTMEFVAGRINLTVVDGVVTRCWHG
ncbi:MULTISPECIES: hypothetical protein [Streptomycetaceae]|nr:MULTISPECIES: hypothetical protein [Streptomycetaceae]MYS58031.1 hypothetical protein [Streptomyces sp. SID5468]CCB73673.1 conserved protein of unknown function [Streptantibioticus cattleyicolor NRRL 8057 = DSM 46488]